MKLRLIVFFIFGIFTSCDNENIEQDVQPVTFRTDNIITVTNLNPKTPKSPSARSPYNLLGYGYDVTGQFGDSSAARHQVIDVVKFKEIEPTSVVIGRTNTSWFRSFESENCEAFSKLMSTRTAATEGSKLFKGAITSFFPDQDAFSAKYIYSTYIFTTHRKIVKMATAPQFYHKYFTEAFRSDIQSKSPQDIVAKYGTHILTDILLGSKLVVMYQAETDNSDRKKAARLGLTAAMNNVFNLFTGDIDNKDATSATGNFSQKISFKSYGGDLRQISQSTYSGKNHPTVNISGWSQSLTTADEELVDFNSSSRDALLPLYEVIEDPIKKEEVKNYIQAYLEGEQVKIQ
ncbi:MAC/perforin domain-containing protein [Pontibacter sp. SGAir0037]|uniref:MAC/perforin domain-containing protein n=1 Tax=Pontibacter sp. SGAir0037 TaxID=2571030 RepID=UPI00143D7CEE|nr:MAC/perforin domain-containing protein [Pontibacter sp. SGAir0037]